MNFLTDIPRQLWRRKLWPVALLLLGALAAVPLLLAKEPQAAVVSAAKPAAKVEGVPATFVSATEPTATETERRRVLGAEKDPFEPAPLPKKKKTAKAKKKQASTSTKTQAPAKTTEDSKGGSTAGGGGSTTPSVTPVATATPEPKKTYPANSVTVRFGTTADSELQSTLLRKTAPLPSDEDPLFVFMGLKDNGKTAVFMITGEATAEGDGSCEPSPEDCQTVELRAGETEFLTLPASEDGQEPIQYQLDVVKLHPKKD